MTPPTLLPAAPPAASMTFRAAKTSVSVLTVKPYAIRFTAVTACPVQTRMPGRSSA